MADSPDLIRFVQIPAVRCAGGMTDYTDLDDLTGIAFSLIRLEAGQQFGMDAEDVECCLVALSGQGTLSCARKSLQFDRPSWIGQGPTAIHCSTACNSDASALRAMAGDAGCELALCRVRNPKPFDTQFFLPKDVREEHRGRGILDDTCYRLVRTAFDRENAPAAAQLVLGEVVAFPGRWSSYPPHHHRQPELYYYRFDPAQGYGHAELGDQVFQVRNHDLLRIAGNRDHAQTAAPGYHMYYLWAVRHLPDDPYTGFEFHPDHAWLWKQP